MGSEVGRTRAAGRVLCVEECKSVPRQLRTACGYRTCDYLNFFPHVYNHIYLYNIRVCVCARFVRYDDTGRFAGEADQKVGDKPSCS